MGLLGTWCSHILTPLPLLLKLTHPADIKGSAMMLQCCCMIGSG